MKPIAIVAVIAGSLVAGFVGATFAIGISQRGPSAAGTESSAAAQAPAQSGRPGAAQESLSPSFSDPSDRSQTEIAALRDNVATLQRDIEDLRAMLDRREPAGRELAAVAKTGGTDEVAALADLNRDAVLKILADKEKLDQDKREADRKQREQEMFGRLAERAAKDLGLSPADQTRLTDFMTIASAKRDELFRGARDGGPDGFRTAFDDFRTWRDTELKSTFGDSLGQQLIDYQREQGRGGFDGFGGGGNSSGGNSGGNNNSGQRSRSTGGGRGG